jgi:glutathione S-transferase
MTKPIELYYWPTPNGKKVSIALEEMGLPYVVKAVNIGKGDQFTPEFLKISPNNRMPAIIDPDGPDGQPISVFESGAILQYLARKTGKFGGATPREQAEVESWVMWQMANLGPVMGHGNHFRNYAPKIETDPAKLEYGVNRFTNEANRLFGVLDTRLEDRDYIAGELSIADFATWPWVLAYKIVGQDMAEFPHLKAWVDRCGAREGFQKGKDVGTEMRSLSLAEAGKEGDAARAMLFGQTARKKS